MDIKDINKIILESTKRLMIYQSFHGVQEIRIEKNEKLKKSGGYNRKIIIMCDNGIYKTEIELSLFSDNKLKVKKWLYNVEEAMNGNKINENKN